MCVQLLDVTTKQDNMTTPLNHLGSNSYPAICQVKAFNDPDKRKNALNVASLMLTFLPTITLPDQLS